MFLHVPRQSGPRVSFTEKARHLPRAASGAGSSKPPPAPPEMEGVERKSNRLQGQSPTPEEEEQVETNEQLQGLCAVLDGLECQRVGVSV